MPRALEVKTLVLVLTTSMSMTSSGEKALEFVPYIRFPVQFKDMSEAKI